MVCGMFSVVTVFQERKKPSSLNSVGGVFFSGYIVSIRTITSKETSAFLKTFIGIASKQFNISSCLRQEGTSSGRYALLTIFFLQIWYLDRLTHICSQYYSKIRARNNISSGTKHKGVSPVSKCRIFAIGSKKCLGTLTCATMRYAMCVKIRAIGQ